MSAAVIVLGPSGLATARRVAGALDDARLHGFAARVEGAEVSFDRAADHLQALFAAGTPIVGVCAAGVLIRAVAPLLSDKTVEPPVIAVAEDASAVVPLLGGHHGANDLARAIADALGVGAAVTTAGDLRFGVALDAPPAGWRLANPADIKAFSAELLAGATLSLDGDAPWLADSDLPIAADGRLSITVTTKAVAGGPDRLVYQPAMLALGMGCERGADPDELIGLAQKTLADAGLASGAVAAVYSIDLKADEAAVHAVADALGVPARFFDAATLEAETPRLANPSEVVFNEVGAHGVAEGAALAAAGPDGVLVAPKQISAHATCAVAQGPAVIGHVGRPRGELTIVGIGPGASDWRTPEAGAAIAAATDLVGYGLYLDLLGPLAAGKQRHDFPLGAEETRCRHALDLAAAGGRVALVSSGDAGIYAMAALVFELIDGGEKPAWRRLAVTVAPGITAMQAAAARIGAPLGHDFCAISLSDLLTPWPAIERRLQAAAAADFVVALYNPVSAARRDQLELARHILLGHRPVETPVVLARNLGRDGESLRVTTLGALVADDADMLTLVLIGSSVTRRIERGDGGVWVYTPRGYQAKP